MRPRASTTSPSSRAVDELDASVVALDASVVALGTKAVPRDEAEGREPRGWRRWNFGKLGARERRGNSEPDYGEQACGSPCLDACPGIIESISITSSAPAAKPSTTAWNSPEIELAIA